MASALRRWVVPLALGMAVCAPRGGRADEQLVDGIAAQVGPDVVLVSEVNELANSVEARARAAGASDDDIVKMKADILDRLIERRLLEQMVKRAELQATDAEVDSTIKVIAKENGLTPEQLRQSVEAGGLTYDAYREKIRSEIQRTKVLNVMVRSRVKVDEREVRKAYDDHYAKQPEGGEEVHLRHILVTFGGESRRDEATACGQVRDALSHIRAGEPFEQVAHRVSELNPERGGDVGWVAASTLAGWMQDIVHKLEPGQTSDVIRMPFGCNLLELVERRQFKKKTYEEVKAELQAQLFEEKTEEEYVKFVNRLRSQTYIEKKDTLAANAPKAAPPPSSGQVTVPPSSSRDFSEGSLNAP
jgi:peptidyl-prolyl cis-trans isomerase SurA